MVANLDEQITVAAVRNGRIIDHVTVQPDGDSAGQELDYLVAKEIGRMFVACGCDVEAIVLSGPSAACEWARADLRRRVLRLAPVFVLE